jgi:hypothetical protein
MINATQLTDADFEKMALEIQEISLDQTEDSLFQTIGNAMHDNGLTVSTEDSMELFQPKAFNEGSEKFNMVKSFSYVSDTMALSAHDAKGEGRSFWTRFKTKLRGTICNDVKIKELLDGEGKLTDFLKTGIPLIIAALGLTVLNPLWLAIIAAVFALILKVGFKTYCEIA